MAVTIAINGINVPANPITTNIAGTYGNVRVINNGGTAQVSFTESTLPTLKLVNAKFLALANGVNASVTFSATSSQGRGQPKMRRTAQGWLVRVENVSAPYTSSTNRGQFIVDGVVISPSMSPNAESIDGLSLGGDTAGSAKVVLAQPFAYGEINLATFTKNENMTSLSGSRTLKGEFSFYLPVINDFLRLTEVKVQTLNPDRGGLRQSELSSMGYIDILEGITTQSVKRLKGKKVKNSRKK